MTNYLVAGTSLGLNDYYAFINPNASVVRNGHFANQDATQGLNTRVTSSLSNPNSLVRNTDFDWASDRVTRSVGRSYPPSFRVPFTVSVDSFRNRPRPTLRRAPSLF